MDETWECIVVGGGAAGLSAALVLGRARRRTLVIDAGKQSNRPAEGMGGVLGHDGRPPGDLYRMGRDELAGYGSVEVRDGSVAGATATEGGFAVDLGGGAVEHARRVVLATGMDYRLPDLPGVAERFGRSVFHCPFCHGWEVRDGRLAVLGHDEAALHRASLLRLWSDDVVLLTDGHDPVADPGVPVDDRPVAEVRGPGHDLEAVVFADGAERPLDGLLVPVRLEQRSPLAARLGLRMTEPGPMPIDAVEVDALGRTSVAGVYAAGDVATKMPSVAAAVAAGSDAARAVVGDLLAER